MFKGAVRSNFDGLQPQPVIDYGKTKKNQIGLQKTGPNQSKLLKQKICCNLFKPAKTGIFVVFHT